MAIGPICEFEACDNPAKKRGYCLKHYSKLRRERQLGAPLGHGKCKLWVESHKDFSGDECLIWPFSRRSNGYGVINLGEVRTGAHRYMCRQAHGDPSVESLMAAHSCGNGHLGCVNPRHLRWATVRENFSDSVKHGTARPVQVRAKLTQQDVAEIRMRLNDESRTNLAKRFGVNRSTIYRIASDRSWTVG